MIATMDSSLLEDMTSKNASYWYILLFFLLPLLPSPLPLCPHIHLPWNSVDSAHRPRSRDKITDLVLFDDPWEHYVGNRPRHQFFRIGEIMEAARMANIHKFISSLPNGFNTRVGQGELTVWWAQSNNGHRMYFFFFFYSLFVIFDFRFSIFDLWISIFDF